MTFNDILLNPFLSIPRNWVELGYKSYFEFILDEGQKYTEIIGELDDFNFGEDKIIGDLSKKSLQSAVQRFYDAIINILKAHLNEGSPYKAYKIFDDSFGIKDGKVSVLRQLGFYLDYKGLYPSAYRIRYVNNPSLDEMFHVPFEKRHKIESYRYSIPGFPTLYLSNSIYLAFQELDCPNYDNLYAVKLQQRSQRMYESLLDMRNQPSYDQDAYKFKYLARWFLVMACSVKVGFPNEPFRPEYILPQITLQWVKNNMRSGEKIILGVCYPSSKINVNIEGFRGQFYNVALPIQLANNSGHCEILKSKFCLTQPLLFKDGLTQNVKATRQSEVISINFSGAQMDYINTDFGKIEEVLACDPFNKYYLVGETKLD